MKESEDKKVYPFPYDYWIDKDDKSVYAVIEYNDKRTDYLHSNLYLVISEYHGNK